MPRRSRGWRSWPAETLCNLCLKLPDRFTEFPWMDRDMRPDTQGATDPFMAADGDIYSDAKEITPTVAQMWDVVENLKAAIARADPV